MSTSGASPAGWYPDTQVPGGERYWDGQQWTDQRRDGEGRVPPPPPPPPAKLPTRWKIGRTVVVILGIMVAAFLVTRGIDWLGSRGSTADDDDSSDASSVDCDSLAQDAVRISKDKDVELLKVRNPTVKQDNRDTYSEPTGDGEALILSCTGEGVWSTGGNQAVLLRFTIDSDGDTFVAYVPQ